MASYEIGLTTFRATKSENLSLPVYMDTLRGCFFKAAKTVNRVVRKEIDWSTVIDYKGFAAIGIFEGGAEPAAHVYIDTHDRISDKLIKELKTFKKDAHQDSILLYEFVSKGGNPVLEIHVSQSNTKSIHEKILKATNGKVGGYLTYVYSLNKYIIVNVKEFDGLTKKQFTDFIPTIKKALVVYHPTIVIKQAKVTVI